MLGNLGTRTQFLRVDEVVSVTGVSKATIRRMELAGSFPRRRKISIRSVGWLAAEVEDWIIARQKADLYDKSVA